MSGSSHPHYIERVICSGDCRTRPELKRHLRFIFRALPDWTAHIDMSSSAPCERVLCLGDYCEDEWEDGCKVLGTASGLSLMCGTVSP